MFQLHMGGELKLMCQYYYRVYDFGISLCLKALSRDGCIFMLRNSKDAKSGERLDGFRQQPFIWFVPTSR